jgi:hypothetical protein
MASQGEILSIAGDVLGTVGNVASAYAANRNTLTNIPPPQALYPGLERGFIQGLQTTGPGFLEQLSGFSETGRPVDVLPAFQQFVSASQRGLSRGRGNILESFGAKGTRFGSDVLQAGVDFEGQANKDFMQIFSQMIMQSTEAARARQFSAAQIGASMYQDVATANYAPYYLQQGGGSAFGTGAAGAGEMLSKIALMKAAGIE